MLLWYYYISELTIIIAGDIDIDIQGNSLPIYFHETYILKPLC